MFGLSALYAVEPEKTIVRAHVINRTFVIARGALDFGLVGGMQVHLLVGFTDSASVGNLSPIDSLWSEVEE